MIIEEIRKNAPYGATHYIVQNDKTYYFRFLNNRWRVLYSYDCGFGWAIARQDLVLNKIKPL